MKISCVTASYVADLLGYPGAIDWGLAAETIEHAPLLETLNGILDRLAPARLDGLEIWFPHVSPKNLTPVLASQVRQSLERRGMVCCACAGEVADPQTDPYACEEAFQVAQLLKAPLIAGHLQTAAVPRLGRIAASYGIRLGFENGSEKSREDIMAAIMNADEWVGSNLDTGNLAAQGGDPVRAVRLIGKRLVHMHLKDVPAVGSHDCVAVGAGIVDVKGVFRELKACGYDGWLSIEVETGDRDPTEAILSSAETIRRLWYI
jgi:sugar phosphate isomerase/epimerase